MQYKHYCNEELSNIENYEDAINSSKQYCIHHRLEIMPYSGKRVTPKYLISQGLYYNQPSDALVFLTISEHISLHKKGVSLSKEHRLKCGNGMKGKHHTLKSRCAISEYQKTHDNSGRFNYRKDLPWNSKRIMNVETGEIFESISAATKIYHGCIKKAVNGEREKAAGYHWKFV